MSAACEVESCPMNTSVSPFTFGFFVMQLVVCSPRLNLSTLTDVFVLQCHELGKVICVQADAKWCAITAFVEPPKNRAITVASVSITCACIITATALNGRWILRGTTAVIHSTATVSAKEPVCFASREFGHVRQILCPTHYHPHHEHCANWPHDPVDLAS
jgi:hypothetical protein